DRLRHSGQQRHHWHHALEWIRRNLVLQQLGGHAASDRRTSAQRRQPGSALSSGRSLIRRTGVVIGVILAAHSAASAEVLLEEREGVLYVKNVEPPQPQPAASQPSSPPGEAVAAKTAAPYRGLIRAAAARHGLASELVEAVIRVESNFEPRAVSSKGARGLMQLMPKTA